MCEPTVTQITDRINQQTNKHINKGEGTVFPYRIPSNNCRNEGRVNYLRTPQL